MSAASGFYIARAAESAAEAQAATLSNVRERCLRSEAAWLAMAERHRRAETMRAEILAKKQSQGAFASSEASCATLTANGARHAAIKSYSFCSPPTPLDAEERA